MIGSAHPESITNILSAPTSLSGSADNEKIVKVMTSPFPKPEAITQISTSSDVSGPSTTTTPANTTPLNLSQSPVNKVPSGNTHLAALMRQYDIIAQNNKLKPTEISGNDGESSKSSKKNQQSVSGPTVKSDMVVLNKVSPILPIQQILPVQCQNFPPPLVRNNDAPVPLFNFASPIPGYGWPMLPFSNPFVPGFLQCFPFPPQLSLLQNQFTFQPSLPQSSQQNGNANKKRKATTVATSPKSQIKRAKEIGNEAV
ncbi:unnamed protein product [Caenorhabditis sp. 36 PRJEB53466]|nr:unnamed protein product [Caenorhabditis sp. 36 PRJEB53466]